MNSAEARFHRDNGPTQRSAVVSKQFHPLYLNARQACRTAVGCTNSLVVANNHVNVFLPLNDATIGRSPQKF